LSCSYQVWMDRRFSVALLFIYFLLVAVLLILPDDLIDFAVIFLVTVLGARSDLVNCILHIIAHVILLFKVKAYVILLLVITLRDATPALPSRAGLFLDLRLLFTIVEAIGVLVFFKHHIL